MEKMGWRWDRGRGDEAAGQKKNEKKGRGGWSC